MYFPETKNSATIKPCYWCNILHINL